MNKWVGKIITRLILIGLTYYGLFYLQSQIYYLLANKNVVDLLDKESPYFLNANLADIIMSFSIYLYITIPFIFFLPEIITLFRNNKQKEKKKGFLNFTNKK